MNIKWSFLAIESLDNICDHLSSQFGVKAKSDFLTAVDKSIKQVAQYPNIGIEEQSLAADGSVHSILVNRLSKFIYYVEDDELFIADVWDIRQNPETLATRFTKQ